MQKERQVFDSIMYMIADSAGRNGITNEEAKQAGSYLFQVYMMKKGGASEAEINEYLTQEANKLES